jgi:hypothetical protein
MERSELLYSERLEQPCNQWSVNVNFALTLQRTTLRFRSQTARGVGKRSAQACGWKPARAKTNALRVGLVYDSRPRPGARPNRGLSPARIMSNHVTPGRKRRPISAKDIHCLGGGNFGRTAPSQIRLVFTLVVQVHDR